MLQPGYYGSLSWNRGGEPSGNISFRMHEDAIELIYRFRAHGAEEWQDVNETVPFTYSRQHLEAGGGAGSFACHVAGNAPFSTAVRTIGAASAGTWPINRSMKRLTSGRFPKPRNSDNGLAARFARMSRSRKSQKGCTGEHMIG